MGYFVLNMVFLVRTINIFSRCDLCGLIANSRFHYTLHVHGVIALLIQAFTRSVAAMESLMV